MGMMCVRPSPWRLIQRIVILRNLKRTNTNTESTPNELGLQIRTQNVVFFYFKEKYTHKPFESKCFLSLFNTIEANG